MDDAIRKALGHATVEACNACDACPHNGLCHDAGECQHGPAMSYAAATIAAFLDEFRRQFPQREPWDEAAFEPSALAAAVRRAAGG